MDIQVERTAEGGGDERAKARRNAHCACLLELLGILVGCTGSPADLNALELEIRERFPDVSQLTIEQYRRNHAGALLVDVRSTEEFTTSHIPGAVHAEDPKAIAKLSESSGSAEVVLYCSVGWRSSQMSERMKGLVTVPVYNLEGSIFAWANGGGPLESDGHPVSVVHPYDESWGRYLDERFWR